MKFLTKQWINVFNEMNGNGGNAQDEKSAMKRKWLELRAEEAQMALENANKHLSQEVDFDLFLGASILGVEETENEWILHCSNGDIHIANPSVIESELSVEDVIVRVKEGVVLVAAELYYLSTNQYELHLMMKILSSEEYYYFTFSVSSVRSSESGNR